MKASALKVIFQFYHNRQQISPKKKKRWQIYPLFSPPAIYTYFSILFFSIFFSYFVHLLRLTLKFPNHIFFIDRNHGPKSQFPKEIFFHQKKKKQKCTEKGQSRRSEEGSLGEKLAVLDYGLANSISSSHDGTRKTRAIKRRVREDRERRFRSVTLIC